MIPISGDTILTHKDEKTGIVYRYRPLLGDAEFRYYSVLEALTDRYDHEPFIKMAEDEVKRLNPDKTWGGDEFNIEVRRTARRMAVEEAPPRTDEELRAEIKALDALIDSVLVGWDAPVGSDFPPFKAPPSAMFRNKDKTEHFHVIMKLNESLTEDEEKN